MKALLIYESIHHGNTKRIAEAIAKVLKAELKKPYQIRDSKKLLDYDLIGFGSGIYFGRFHQNLYDLIRKLPKMKNKKAFIFSTSGVRTMIFNRFRPELRRKLRAKGFNVIGKFSCRGYDSYALTKLVGGLNKGRPNKKDLKKAADFARDLKKKVHK